jgi:hypothetical protein
MSIVEIIGVIILYLILFAVVVMMFPLVVDTVRNEIDLIKKEIKRKRKGE